MLVMFLWKLGLDAKNLAASSAVRPFSNEAPLIRGDQMKSYGGDSTFQNGSLWSACTRHSSYSPT